MATQSLVVGWALALFGAAGGWPQAGAAQDDAGTACTADAARQPLLRPASINIVGVSLFDDEVVRRTLLPFQGSTERRGLCEAVAAMQSLYRRAGWVGIHVYMNRWEADADGKATLFVIEGRLSGPPVVAGASRFSADNVRASLPALSRPGPLHMTDLDLQLRMANENPAKSVHVLLDAGRLAGELDARVELVEQPVWHVSVSLDNTGTQATGTSRATLGWRHANLGGVDDAVSVDVSTSPRHADRLLSIGGALRVPDYDRGVMWEGFAAYSNVNDASSLTEAGAVSFSGGGRQAGLRATLFLARLGELDQRLGLVGEYRAYLNQCAVAGLPDGACGPAGVSVATSQATIEYSLSRTIRQPVFMQLALARNTRGGGHLGQETQFELARPGARPGSSLARLNLGLSAGLPENWELHLRAAWQGSRRPLIAGEQLGVGGANNVRGYEEREVAGDRGLFASVQVQAPIHYGAPFTGSKWYVFVDGARVSNVDRSPCNAGNWRCPLAGAGIGGRLRAGGLTLQLDVARALRSGTRSESGDWRAHASSRYVL